MRLGSHFKEERLQGQRKVMTKMDYFYNFFFFVIWVCLTLGGARLSLTNLCDLDHKHSRTKTFPDDECCA